MYRDRHENQNVTVRSEKHSKMKAVFVWCVEYSDDKSWVALGCCCVCFLSLTCVCWVSELHRGAFWGWQARARLWCLNAKLYLRRSIIQNHSHRRRMTPECLKNKSCGGREMDGRKLYEKSKSWMHVWHAYSLDPVPKTFRKEERTEDSVLQRALA